VPPELPDDVRFRFAAERAAAKIIDGDAIVIDTVTGRYYSLEGTAEAAWSLLTASLSLAEAARALAQRYEVSEAEALADLRTLADELLAENLLVPAPDAQAPELGARQAAPAPYTRPVLSVFRDMEDMLAFDPPLPQPDAVWTARPPKA
jgi:hypothetical protein